MYILSLSRPKPTNTPHKAPGFAHRTLTGTALVSLLLIGGCGGMDPARPVAATKQSGVKIQLFNLCPKSPGDHDQPPEIANETKPSIAPTKDQTATIQKVEDILKALPEADFTDALKNLSTAANPTKMMTPEEALAFMKNAKPCDTVPQS